MHVSLEYIAVTLMIMIAFYTSFQMIMSTLTQLQHTTEEQLYVVAERVMDKVLLTPGYPPDWGTNFTSNLEDFGLALYGYGQPYVLDSSKVMRLVNYTWLGNPLYLDPANVADLLGLTEEGVHMYGFRIDLLPYYSLNVTPIDNAWPPRSFNVTLSDYQGMRLAGARVTALYLVFWGDCAQYNYAVYKQYGTANLFGNATLAFAFDQPPGTSQEITAVLLVYADWYGSQAAGHWVSSSAGTTTYLTGSYVVVEEGFEPSKSGAEYLALQGFPGYEDVVPVELETDSFGNPVYSTIQSGGITYKVYRLSYLEAPTSHVILVGCSGTRLTAYVAARLASARYTYGSLEDAEPVNEVTLTRLVYVAGYAYVAKLSIWRWAE